MAAEAPPTSGGHDEQPNLAERLPAHDEGDFRVFGENSKVGLTETRYGILPDMGATSDCPESLAKAELAVRLAGQPPLAVHGARRAIDAAWFLDPDDSFAVAVERRSAAWSPRTSRKRAERWRRAARRNGWGAEPRPHPGKTRSDRGGPRRPCARPSSFRAGRKGTIPGRRSHTAPVRDRHLPIDGLTSAITASQPAVRAVSQAS